MAQPQTQDVANPHLTVQLNAKWTNGVAPGYRPTAGSGLTLNLSAGTSFARNVRASYAGGTLSLTDNATNYVFLDTTASNAPTFNTSGYPTTGIPIATVITASGAITTITDDRTLFNPPLPGGTNHQTQINAAGAFGGVGPGTAGQYLRSGGASADPAYGWIAESEVAGLVSDLALKAPLASPALTGTPTAPTPTIGDDSTKIATTAFVEDAVDNLVAGDIPNIAESQVTGLVSDLAGKVPTTRQINTTAPLTGGGDLSADRTLAISAATATAAGLVPTPPNDATKYLDGTANWSKPPNTAINFADNETVTASGTSATLAHTPNPSGSLILVVDGQVFTVGAGADFTISGATITFATAPRAGANIRAWYRY